MKKRFSLVTVSGVFLLALFLGVQINNVISGRGFEKIPDSTSADIGLGVLAPLGTKCRVQQ